MFNRKGRKSTTDKLIITLHRQDEISNLIYLICNPQRFEDSRKTSFGKKFYK